MMKNIFNAVILVAFLFVADKEKASAQTVSDLKTKNN